MKDRSAIPFVILFPIGTALLVIGINTTPVLIAFGGMFLLAGLFSLAWKRKENPEDIDDSAM